MAEGSEDLRDRVLILTPLGRDAELASAVLCREHLRPEICKDMADMVSKLDAAGAAVIADEALNGNLAVVTTWVSKQSAWSDFPFIVLTSGHAPEGNMQRRFEVTQPLGNVTLLERPLRSITLLSVVKAALRARARQFEVEHYIEEMRQADRDRSQAFAREQAAHAQVELLNHVGEILSAELNLNLLLPAVVQAGTDLSGADLGIFFGEDSASPGSNRFVVRCTSGITVPTAASLLGESFSLDALSFSDRKAVHCTRLDRESSGPAGNAIRATAERLSLGNCVAIPVTSRRGRVVGVLLFGHLSENPFSDRDQRVATSLASQAAIAIDNARLFAMAERETRRLEAARQVLQRSNEELRQFAYVASHDLQEPLRTVASFTQLLVNRYRGQAGPDADEFVAFIVEGVERMSCLIRDLLQYSYTGVAKPLPSEPVVVEPALREVIFSLSAAIQESGATITYDPLPDVWLDGRSLILLFQNLVGNAIKYRGQNPPRIHIRAESSEDFWVFSIQDNGIGIAAQYHDRIFGIFKRLHGREIPGTGIGLAICQRIVEWHGGKIWLESTPGAGSIFHFSLPKEPHRIQQEMAEFASLGAST